MKDRARLIILQVGIAAGSVLIAPSARSQNEPTVRDSAGIRIIENEKPAWPVGKGWTIDTTSPVVLRSGRSNEAFLFNQVISAAFAADGRIVVQDDRTYGVLIFEPDGRYRRTIGQKGEGPGEFRVPRPTYTVAGDRLIAWDDAQRRLSTFSVDGVLISDERLDHLPESPARFPVRVVGLRRDGTLLVTIPILSSWPGKLAPIDVEAKIELIRPDGGSALSFGTIVDMRAQGMGADGRLVRLVLTALARSRRYLIDAAGFALSTPDLERWEIRQYDGKGSLRRIVRATIVREPVPAAMARHARASGWSDTEIKLGLPAIHDVFQDDGGNLWIGRQAVEPNMIMVERVPSTRYDVIGSSGRWLGTVTIPAGVGRVLAVQRDKLLAVWKDKDDVPVVRTFRIHKGG